MPRLELPWGAWSEAGERRCFEFPDTWTLERLGMNGWAVPTQPDYQALAAYVRGLVAGARSVCIAVEDLTRPTPLEPVMEVVLTAIEGAGVAAPNIDIVAAVGAHAACTPEQLRLKLGDRIVSGYNVRSHELAGDLADSGHVIGGVPVRLDRRFLDADIRIAVGCVIPNPYAGFSGGGKMVIPGLAGMDVLKWLHRLAHMGGSRGPGVLAGNRIRAEIDRFAEILPLHGSVLCLLDERRSIREVYHGPPVSTHTDACAAALIRYRTPMTGRYDVLLCNAYPKDAEFIQSATGYTPLRTGGMQHLDAGGSVVLLSAAWRGLGHHALFERGAPLHRPRTAPHRELGGASIMVYSPGVRAADVEVTHWNGYPVHTEWESLISALVARHGTEARAGVFPAGAMQLGPAS